MPRYKVTGTDQQTGFETSTVVEAATRSHACKAAEAEGLDTDDLETLPANGEAVAVGDRLGDWAYNYLSFSVENLMEGVWFCFLVLCGMGFAAFGIYAFSISESIMHELFAMLSLLIAAVLITGASIFGILVTRLKG